jgi:hypothetical protein
MSWPKLLHWYIKHGDVLQNGPMWDLRTVILTTPSQVGEMRMEESVEAITVASGTVNDQMGSNI